MTALAGAWPPTLRETVAQLQAWRGRTTKGALVRLKTFHESLTLLELYQQRWPAEFAASTASLFGSSDEHALYSPREMEFLHKVETLFPVYLDALLECDERWNVIPVRPVAYDLEGDWGPGASLLIGLAFGEPHRTPEELGMTVVPTMDPGRELELVAFQARCLALHPVLHDIGQVMAVAGNQADNVWTDVTELMLAESDGYPEWDAETLEALTVEWRAAEPLFARFTEVAQWLDAARPHCNAFVKAWNASLRRRRQDHDSTP